MTFLGSQKYTSIPAQRTIFSNTLELSVKILNARCGMVAAKPAKRAVVRFSVDDIPSDKKFDDLCPQLQVNFEGSANIRVASTANPEFQD